MRLRIVDKCKWCGTERISREDCKNFGHSNGTVACIDCCCYGDEGLEERDN